MRIPFLRCFAAALAVVATVSTVPGLIAVADAQPSSPQRSRVVIQVSDADQAKWNLALNNAKNVQTDLGAANVDIEIVVYGAGAIGMLKFDSPVGNRVGEALASGVKVVACETTMRGQGLARGDMLKDIGYVGSGVVELMSKQQQGWAYIRP
jgi:intracellular sulfur oxidation DsrE/DsrF family protein